MQTTPNTPKPKQPYTAPRLTVHGTLEDLTKLDKGSGASDGYAFKGLVITHVS